MEIRKKLAKRLTRLAQKLIDKAYYKYGMTDDLLDTQIRLNELRNEFDINETNDEFVQ